MTLIEAIILGLLQGLTEFIPISSSGHLVIAQTFMGIVPDHLFLEWVNIGTVLALVIFFRHRILSAIRTIFQKKDYRLLRNIVIAMLPAGLAGFMFADFIEGTAFFGSVWTVVFTLFLVGILLILLERLPKLSSLRTSEALSPRRALGIGLAQVMALIPGTSRSGATIIAGRVAGLSRAAAAEFSFLVSIPIMLGVIVKLVTKDADRAYFVANALPLTVANIVAFISGLLAVGFLMRYLEKHNLSVFGWYRIGLAVVLIGLLLLK